MKPIQYLSFSLSALISTVAANGAITYALSSTATPGKGVTHSETDVSLIAGDVLVVMAAKSSSASGTLSVTSAAGTFTGGAIQFDDTSNTFIYEYTVTSAGLFDISYQTAADPGGVFATAGFFALRADSGEISRLGVEGNFGNNGVTPNNIALNWGTSEDVSFLGTYTSGNTTTVPSVFDGGSRVNGGDNRILAWGSDTDITGVSASWVIDQTDPKNSRTTLVAYTEVVPEPSSALLGAVGTMLLLRRRR